MSLTPDQARLLDTIACQLRRTDPRLARRLTGPLRPALSRVRELVVLIVLLAEMALGFLPLAWGLASFSTLLLDAGLVSAFIATPALMWFTTTWAQHRWVRFEATRRPGDPEHEPRSRPTRRPTSPRRKGSEMAADDHRKISDGGHSDPGVDPAMRDEAAGDRREGRNPGLPEPADPDSHVLPGAHLVLGHRHGPLGTAALRVGADLATRLRAALHVVHVVDLMDYPIDPDAWDWEQQADRALLAERRDVETELAELGTPWTYRADRGDPVSLLRQVADDHDALMIIVGTRGEGAGQELSRLLGTPSVSHGLVARTHRPVLVVPPHAAAPPNATDR